MTILTFVSISCGHFPPCMGILTSCPPCATISYLVWVFSPHMTILTLCPCPHDHYTACMGIPTLCDNSHLVSTSHDHFPPHMGISHLASTLYNHFPPCMGDHFHLASTSHDHFSPHVGILTSHPPCMTICHLVWAFSLHMTIPSSSSPHVTISHYTTLPFCMTTRWGWPHKVTLQKYKRENSWKSSSFVLWTVLR